MYDLLIPTALIYDSASDTEEIRAINSSVPDFWNSINTISGYNASSRSKCGLVPRNTAQKNNSCILTVLINGIYWLKVL